MDKGEPDLTFFILKPDGHYVFQSYLLPLFSTMTLTCWPLGEDLLGK